MENLITGDNDIIDKIFNPRYEVIERSLELNINEIYIRVYDYNYKYYCNLYFVKREHSYSLNCIKSNFVHDVDFRQYINKFVNYLNFINKKNDEVIK